MRKPIGPALHGALDYGFLAAMLTVPRLLRLPWRARAIAALVGAAQGGLNAVTDQPLAVRRMVPYDTHRTVDRVGLPVALTLPLLVRGRGARAFFAASGAALAAVYALTDWDAQQRGAAEAGSREPTYRQPGPQSLGSAGPDAGGVTDSRSATDPATPAEGPADAAGPSAGATGANRADGPRRPATVDTAPDIRSGGSATAHAASTGAAPGDRGEAGADDLDAVARERVDELPGETALGRRDPAAGGGTGDPADYFAEHEGRGGR